MARVLMSFPSGDVDSNLDKVHSVLNGFDKDEAQRNGDGSVEATMQGSVEYIRNMVLLVVPDANVQCVPGREEENVPPDPAEADDGEFDVEEDPR